MRLADESRFTRSCLPEVGRLLHILAGLVRDGVVGEIGCGQGVGAAWIVSALSASVRMVTVEIEPTRAATVASLLAPYPNAHVIQGDWRRLLEWAPFSLLFVDARDAKEHDPETVLGAVRPGGTIVLDDLTPARLWTPEQQILWVDDPVRGFWLNDARVVATELQVAAACAVIVATRRHDWRGHGEGR